MKKNFIRLIALLFIITAAVLVVNVADHYFKQSDNLNVERAKDSNFLIYGSKEKALDELNKLTIAEPDNSDYSGNTRGYMYGGWKSVKGSNTRIEVLKDQADNVEMNGNKIAGGTWYINYTGKTVTYSNKEEVSKNLQIDHIVPVSYAHRHGASNWDEDKRKEFYNDCGRDTIWSNGVDNIDNFSDVGNLIVSDSSSNIQKSDSGPSEWLPSNKDFVLNYCERWVKICNNYGISITQADYNTIKEVFENA